MLIAVSGTDCVGKSTQIEKLVKKIEATGESSRLIWYRPGYSKILDFARKTVRKISPISISNAGRSAARKRAFARSEIRKIWLLMALVDMAFQYGLFLRLAMTNNRFVICDRYIIDAFIDLMLRFPESKYKLSRMKRLYEKILPKPDVNILLVLDREIIVERLAKKNEPFPDDLPTRELRWDAYDQAGEFNNITTIDGGKNINSVSLEISSLIFEKQSPGRSS